MAVIYRNSLRTNRLRLVVNELGSASAPTIPLTGTAAGTLVIGTQDLSGDTGVLAVIPLDQTPAVVAGDVLTLSGFPKIVSATGSGTAAKAELRNNAGEVIVSGLTCGMSNADIQLSGTIIVYGQLLQVMSGSITAAVA